MDIREYFEKHFFSDMVMMHHYIMLISSNIDLRLLEDTINILKSFSEQCNLILETIILYKKSNNKVKPKKISMLNLSGYRYVGSTTNNLGYWWNASTEKLIQIKAEKEVKYFTNKKNKIKGN